KTDFSLSTESFRSDPFILQRILENLISNALKFTKPNGEISIKIALEEEKFTVSVKDNGPGIPKDEHVLLFKKFGKTSSLPTGNEPSTGLGLYIVNSLINKMKGQITLNSDTGKGTEFLIDIPL
ncbi:MAG: ATP-binding protein, partial [Reichenbachiella sp.]